jgi:hypothetical protein
MYIVLALSFFIIFLFLQFQPPKKSIKPVKETVKKEIKQNIEKLKTKNSIYKYRKYTHVKNFYKNVAKIAIDVGIRYNVPPPALLAIAGVESGYARGYVSKITGNILSLGAGKDDPELPPLYLPHLKKKPYKVIYGSSIKKYKKSDLIWRQRNKSLKKDYRPKKFAGSDKELDYFDYHPKERLKAYKECLSDFAKNWISRQKRYKAFQDARVFMDSAVKTSSKEILFDKELNEKFIKMISGKKNSFNTRKSWAPKVIKVLKKAGLVELCYDMYKNHKTFKEAWRMH